MISFTNVIRYALRLWPWCVPNIKKLFGAGVGARCCRKFSLVHHKGRTLRILLSANLSFTYKRLRNFEGNEKFKHSFSAEASRDRQLT